MTIKSIDMVWMVVSDLSKAIEYYTKVVGLILREHDTQYGWAELSGKDARGTRLGLAQKSDHEPIKPGQNGIVTLTVDNIREAKEDLSKKGAKFVGDILEVPNIVKLQMIVDVDGNHFQLVECNESHKECCGGSCH